MNGDGKLDLMTGCFEGGVYVLDGLGDGKFAEPRPILDKEGAWLRLGRYWDQEEDEWTSVETSHFAGEHGVSAAPIDWDADGDFDLLLGASSGHVFLRLNEGSATKYAYAPHSIQVEAGGKKMKTAGSEAMVITADWDGDGKWDILAGGGSGQVEWFRNVGEAGAPVFASRVVLVEAVDKDESPMQPTRSGPRVQIAVGDHNGDGLLDLLVGDNSTVPAPQPDLSDEEKLEVETLRKEKRKLRAELSKLIESAGEDADLEKFFEEDPEVLDLTERMGEVDMRLTLLAPPSTRHGWIWFYERKGPE